MSDPNATAPASKPATQSMTLQGAVLGVVGGPIVAAIVPVVAGWIGVDPHQLTEAIGAAVTLASFAMVVIGRFRASTKLA